MREQNVDLSEITCPETGMIFCDPVSFESPETGTQHVYERLMLLHWSKLHNMRCPYDVEIPSDENLISNSNIKRKIKQFIAENPTHAEAIRYKKYQDQEAKWRKNNTSEDANAFAYDQIKQYRSNCYNARAQKTAQVLMLLCLTAFSTAFACQYFGLLAISSWAMLNIGITCTLGTLVASLLWLWPQNTNYLQWLIGSSLNSVPMNECRTLESLWNPETIQTLTRFQSPKKPGREIDQSFVKETLNHQAIYALSFAQLVLGCPDLQLFNTANETTLPTQKLNGKEVSLLDRNTHTLADYHARKQAISNLKAYEKSPKMLSFPNSIPFPLWPIRGLFHVTNGILNIALTTPAPKLSQKIESSTIGGLKKYAKNGSSYAKHTHQSYVPF